jgi:tetratricopeptide (TPR) repeat protein
VVQELSALEKALSKSDYEAQKGSLEQILKAVRPLRLRSLEQLDLNTRGRLLTTLLRVQRQPKPPSAPAPEAAPPTEAAPHAEAAPTEEAPASEGSAEAPEAAAAKTSEGEAPGEQAAAPAAEAPPAAPAQAGPPDKSTLHADALFLVGRIWRGVGEEDRAQTAFAASGRAAPSADEKIEAERPQETQRRASPDGKNPRARREREVRDRGPKREPIVVPPGGDWQAVAKELESKGRTRDAGRLCEQNKAFADGARLFEAGGDLRSALRCAAQANDAEAASRLISQMKTEDWPAMLEKLGAYEILMQQYVARGDFANVARLYERARQFDQAALAWERAEKYSFARKAFERAKDTANAERLRNLETEKLIERGDRLGAALSLVAAHKRERAVEVLTALPGPKAYRFMMRAGLDAEAHAYAEKELAAAREGQKHQVAGRWLEMLGRAQEAAEAFEAASRPDRAYPLYEQLGNPQKAAALAEAAGHREKAIELYRKVGDVASAERVEKLPASNVVSAPTSDPDEEAHTDDASAQPEA